MNADPNAEELADIAIPTAELARAFELRPRIAMLSYSNFGTDRAGSPAKVRRAVELVRARRPDLEVDGEMQVEAAALSSVHEAEFPFMRPDRRHQRAHFPRPEQREHRLQAALARAAPR